jgi:aspartate-semialdehyde dehydrogenase
MNQKHKVIAIVGATGNVGPKIIEILIERKTFDANHLKCFSSSRSVGQQLKIGGHDYIIEDIEVYDFKNCFLALFATESDISKRYIPKALEAGVKVVDSSSMYRLDPQVPLIVPPVNAQLITKKHNLLAVANCLASPISVVLKPLHSYATVVRVLITTFQSTSGAGKLAIDELYQQTKSVYSGKHYPCQVFNRQIAFNVIPQIDQILDDGFSYEEYKIMKEIQKIIAPRLKVLATAVRVPVKVGHSISLSVEFAKQINLEDIKAMLSNSQGIQLSTNHYTTPVEVEGKNDVFVGRVRIDSTIQNGLLLWLVSDNLRRGAALDAVEIAEQITRI